jgi:FkbM family methyltransferase
MRLAAKRIFERLGYGVVRRERLEALLRTEESHSRIMSFFESIRGVGRDERAQALEFVNFCIEHNAISRSQLFQDLFVLWVLHERRGGFFVEFGAADGVKFSNTCLLEREYGWTGIVAEPGRVWHRALDANRTCAIDHGCVWSRSGERLVFNEVGLLSTVDAFSSGDEHGNSRRHGERYAVETLSLDDLLRKHDAPATIDFLSIDTEGSEFEILQAFDFDRYDVRVLAVEHNHTSQREQLYALLDRHGFRRRFTALSGCDDWYVKP